MKKTKRPGENFSLKTKKSEDPQIMQWINAQSNLMDSFRYLIENEIVRNGIRNLQAHIPSERNWNAAAGAGGGRGLPVPLEPEPVDEEDDIDDEDIESWT